MRRLLLLRHAKTERTNPRGDHARLLVERGREDAARMGAWLAREGLAPDAALVSDAARTRETFSLLASAMVQALPVQFDSALYLAQPATILDAIHGAPENASTLMLIGHNPGIHQLAHDLGQRGPRQLVDLLAANFPTCCLAVIECEVESWREIQPALCRLARLQTAKKLRAAPAAGDTNDC